METINIISIRRSVDERTYFAYENGAWTRNEETRTLDDDGTKDVTTSTQACTAEDVIVALLQNMCKEDVNIDVAKRRGTAIPVQYWRAWGSDLDKPYNGTGGFDLCIE